MSVLRTLALASLVALSPAGTVSAQGWDRTVGGRVDDEVPPPADLDGASSTGTVVVVPAAATSVAEMVEAPPEPPRPRPDHSIVMMVLGTSMLVAGYGGAAAWGGYYVDSLHLGPQGCNDTYAAWQFVPTIGPIVGVFAGGACVPGGLHVEEAVLPFVFSLVQIAGVVLLPLGAVLHEQRASSPRVALSVDPSGGFARLAWSF